MTFQTLKAEEKKNRLREREALKREIAAREKEEYKRKEMEERWESRGRGFESAVFGHNFKQTLTIYQSL